MKAPRTRSTRAPAKRAPRPAPSRRHQPELVATPVHYFRAAARFESIRAAAEFLHVAPSAVSRQIARLEDALGSPLFERLPRGLKLTSAGEVFLYHAREGGNQLERARTLIDDIVGLRRGHVSLATSESVANGVLPDLLVQFWQKFPGVSVAVQVMRSLDAVNAAVRGDVELAIGYDVPDLLPLKTLATARLRIGAVMARDHRLAGAKSVRIRDFLDGPIFLPDDTQRLRAVLNPFLRRATITFEPRLTSNSLTVLYSLVALNSGVVFQTKIGVETEWFRSRLAFVPLQDTASRTQDLQLCSRAQALTPAAAALAKAVAVRFEKMSDI